MFFINRVSCRIPTKLSLLRKYSTSPTNQVNLPDHRVIGTQQNLFQFHSNESAGSPVFLAHGHRIIDRLLSFFQSHYRLLGYSLVITPTIYHSNLWKQSGHWQLYKDDMFNLTEDYSIKPMNCPGHCLIFNSTTHSYKDLPIKIAEFSPLHRNEASGALTGLLRTRKFHQDDAHIFCLPSQINQQITENLWLLDKFYSILGLQYSPVLSTRPDDFLGDIQDWNNAEDALKEALESHGKKYDINPGDGAFYGPKIDFKVLDNHSRSHQLATIQLDFQLPKRFELSYVNKENSLERPVIIHRAIMGSIERMFAILTEHFNGKWPIWLSPRQAIVIPIFPDEKLVEYSQWVRDVISVSGTNFKPFQQGNPFEKKTGLYDRFHYIDVDSSQDTLNRRILAAHDLAYNYVLVVGEKEMSNGTVNVRPRGVKKGTEMSVLDFCKRLRDDEDDFR